MMINGSEIVIAAARNANAPSGDTAVHNMPAIAEAPRLPAAWIAASTRAGVRSGLVGLR
jgi:hypothetical protein